MLTMEVIILCLSFEDLLILVTEYGVTIEELLIFFIDAIICLIWETNLLPFFAILLRPNQLLHSELDSIDQLLFK